MAAYRLRDRRHWILDIVRSLSYSFQRKSRLPSKETSADDKKGQAKQGPPANICLPLPIPILLDSPTGTGLTEKTVSMRNAALRAIDSVTSLTNSVIRFVSRQNGQVEA